VEALIGSPAPPHEFFLSAHPSSQRPEYACARLLFIRYEIACFPYLSIEAEKIHIPLKMHDQSKESDIGVQWIVPPMLSGYMRIRRQPTLAPVAVSSAKVNETPSSSSHHALAWLLGRSRNCNCERGRSREELRMSRYADSNPFLLPLGRDSEVSYAIVVDSPQRPLVPGD